MVVLLPIAAACIEHIVLYKVSKWPSFNPPAEVKRAGDNLIGVRTQCVVTSTLKKTNRPTLTNLCLKINVKFGGTNSIIFRCVLCMEIHVYSTLALYK